MQMELKKVCFLFIEREKNGVKSNEGRIVLQSHHSTTTHSPLAESIPVLNLKQIVDE